jgi:hypothetical protein
VAVDYVTQSGKTGETMAGMFEEHIKIFNYVNHARSEHHISIILLLLKQATALVFVTFATNQRRFVRNAV